MEPAKRITVSRHAERRIFVIPAAQAEELKVGDLVILAGEGEPPYRVRKIEDTEMLVIPR
jgi:uncharacterized Zn finger protein